MTVIESNRASASAAPVHGNGNGVSKETLQKKSSFGHSRTRGRGARRGGRRDRSNFYSNNRDRKNKDGEEVVEERGSALEDLKQTASSAELSMSPVIAVTVAEEESLELGASSIEETNNNVTGEDFYETGDAAISPTKEDNNNVDAVAATVEDSSKPQIKEEERPNGQYLEIVQKRLRALRKRLSKIEKYEIVSATEALNEDQRKAVEKKSEVLSLISEFEELEKQFRPLLRDETKKMKKEKKLSALREQKSISDLTEKLEAENEKNLKSFLRSLWVFQNAQILAGNAHDFGVVAHFYHSIVPSTKVLTSGEELYDDLIDRCYSSLVKYLSRSEESFPAIDGTYRDVYDVVSSMEKGGFNTKVPVVDATPVICDSAKVLAPETNVSGAVEPTYEDLSSSKIVSSTYEDLPPAKIVPSYDNQNEKLFDEKIVDDLADRQPRRNFAGLDDVAIIAATPAINFLNEDLLAGNRKSSLTAASTKAIPATKIDVEEQPAVHHFVQQNYHQRHQQQNEVLLETSASVETMDTAILGNSSIEDISASAMDRNQVKKSFGSHDKALHKGSKSYSSGQYEEPPSKIISDNGTANYPDAQGTDENKHANGMGVSSGKSFNRGGRGRHNNRQRRYNNHTGGDVESKQPLNKDIQPTRDDSLSGGQRKESAQPQNPQKNMRSRYSGSTEVSESESKQSNNGSGRRYKPRYPFPKKQAGAANISSNPVTSKE